MKTAMILAAGRGERLKPYTLYKPKALCEVRGQSLIERHIKALNKAGFERIVINHAYLGGMIRHHVQSLSVNSEILFTPEPPGGLETAGGIVNALPFLGERFFVVNGDIVTDFDFSTVNLDQPYPLHFYLVEKPDDFPQGDFGLSADNRVENHNRQYIFSGLAVYQSSVFTPLKFGRYGLPPLFRTMVEENRVSGEVFRGQWIDIGSPERLRNA